MKTVLTAFLSSRLQDHCSESTVCCTFSLKFRFICKKKRVILFYFMLEYVKIIVTNQNNKINEAYGCVKLATLVEVPQNSLFESGRKLKQ